MRAVFFFFDDNVNSLRERRSLGSLVTENQKRPLNRMDQTKEAIRQTQQMQQMTEVMFQQFFDKLQVDTSEKWRLATLRTNQ